MKYGGPFDTEQVEDVKTILRLLAISLPLSLVILSFTFLKDVLNKFAETPLGLNGCTKEILRLFVYSSFLYGCLGHIVYEFFYLPFGCKQASQYTQENWCCVLDNNSHQLYNFTLKLAIFLSHSNEINTEWIVQVFHQSTGGLLSQILVTLILQFMCAQSPYNMRGLLLSLVVFFVIASGGVHVMLGYYITTKVCTKSWCFLVSFSVTTTLCFIGFLLFCVVARWYKLRVRDDDYSPQRVVEEVYDRYLTAAAAHSRSYGVRNTYRDIIS